MDACLKAYHQLSQLATQPATRLVVTLRTNRQTKNHYSIDKKLVATLNLLEYSQGFKSCASRQPSEQGR